MLALCLNLEDARDRWEMTQSRFLAMGIELSRFSAVVGRNLRFPIAEFNAEGYRRCHGKQTIPAEVGCFLSHIGAMKTFLATNAELALICEDDVKPVPQLPEILQNAFAYREHWDILRLSGFHHARPQPVATLGQGYSLCVNLGYLAGSGAYVINRHAASVLSTRLLPMFLPYDHALDRDWLWGLRSLRIDPLPIDQGTEEFISQIDTRYSKLAWYRRYWTVLPFRLQTQSRRFAARSHYWLRLKWKLRDKLPQARSQSEIDMRIENQPMNDGGGKAPLPVPIGTMVPSNAIR